MSVLLLISCSKQESSKKDAPPARAAWVKVGETDDSVYYFDPATILKMGQLRRVWTLSDLKNREADGQMSRRALDEFDCAGERYRIISMSGHSEPMAGGQILFSGNPPEKWFKAGPAILKIICAP